MRASNSIYSLLHLDIKLLSDSLKSVEDELNLQKGKVSDAVARLEILAAVVNEISEDDCGVQAQSWSKGLKKVKSKSLNVPVEEKCPGQCASDNEIGEMIKGLRESVDGIGNDKDEINMVDTCVEELSTTRPSLTKKFGTKKEEIKPAELHDVATGVHLPPVEDTDEESRLSPPEGYHLASQLGIDAADRDEKTMMLPKIDVGAIIGFKGCTVNKIRRLSGAQIVITGKREDKVNTVILKGRTKQVRKASEMIEKLLQDTVVKTLTLSTIDVGVIIGAEGCMVNKIRRMSGALIHFDGSREDEVNTVVLRGRTDKVRKALEMIEKLRQDTVVKTLTLPAIDIGVIIGAEGCMANKIRRMSGVLIDHDGSREDEVNTVVLRGRTDQVRKALEMIQKLLRDTVVATLTLPSSLNAGAIIGEKGCRMKELQRSTSTIIHVRRPGGKDNPRQIEVRGMREQVIKAMETIKQIIGVEEEFVIEKLVS